MDNKTKKVKKVVKIETTSSTENVPKEHTKQIVVLRDFCTHIKGSDCQRCVLACPVEAISFDENGRPTINEEACTLCGICLGICDAFTSARVTMEDLHERFCRIARRGEQVVATCQYMVPDGFQPAANVVVLPCLACLSPEFWTLLLAENLNVKISVVFKDCNTCPRAGGVADMLYTHAIDTAEDCTERKVGYSRKLPEKENIVRMISDEGEVDRRGIFDNVVEDVGEIVSGRRHLRNSKVLNEWVDRRERSRARARLNLSEGIEFEGFVPKGTVRKTMGPKRQMLLEAIEREPELAPRLLITISQTNSELCKNEHACTDVCPTGARSVDPKTKQLVFDETYCVGCGLCVSACPKGAIELVETTAEVFVPEKPAEEETPSEPQGENDD